MGKVDLISTLLIALLAVGAASLMTSLGVAKLVNDELAQSQTVEIKSVGFLQEFSVDCLATATVVRPPEGASSSIACKCDAAVSWGSEDVTTGGYESDDWGGNVREAYCIAGSTATCKCISLVSSR